MFKIKKQISGLYLSSVLGNLSLTGAWVAILAARGCSLPQIGIAETVFHITSLIFELPSGMLADVFGRKKMAVGGFISAAGDDALQVRTNAVLQDMFPSEQRATLTSLDSFLFSVIMIVLSPLAGIVFSIW